VTRIHPTAAEGFDRNATEYERARPGYPLEVLDIIGRALELQPGARLCDLAAGTGKLTRLLVNADYSVVAVEPVEGMRAQLREVLPDVEVLDGTAEALPFPGASIDAVTVAQAFHWFRFDEALAEIRRVLRPGGGLAIAFNRRDEDAAEWVARWSEIIDWHKRTVSSYQRTDWKATIESGGFVDFGAASIPWVQPLTRALLADRVRSISYIALMEPDEQQEKVDAVLALVDGFDEPFDLPYVTQLWWGRKPA
jgi:ubiquinone/menaquinone biosynthesis C-methylase UbiE